MLNVVGVGLAPPCTAENESEVGLTLRIGVPVAVPTPYPDSGQSVKDEPEVHVAGRVASPVLLLSSDLHGPRFLSRKKKFPLPVPSTAIQYCVPDVMVVAGTLMVFQAPV